MSIENKQRRIKEKPRNTTESLQFKILLVFTTEAPTPNPHPLLIFWTFLRHFFLFKLKQTKFLKNQICVILWKMFTSKQTKVPQQVLNWENPPPPEKMSKLKLKKSSESLASWAHGTLLESPKHLRAKFILFWHFFLFVANCAVYLKSFKENLCSI